MAIYNQSKKNLGVAVVGFPYIRENYFEVFRHWPDPDNILFLLPRKWPIKSGKSVFHPPADVRIETASAYFSDYHWKYPVIGGILKGWMPAFPLFLWKHRKKIDLVYACSEPILLSTLYYSLWSKLFRKKLVLFSWENIPYEQKFKGASSLIHKTLMLANLRLATGLLCGNMAGTILHRRYSSLPIANVPMNGIDANFFNAQNKSKLFRHYNWNGKIVYTFIGAIGYRKGVHVALEAFKSVRQRISNAVLAIAGSGEYEKELDQQIERLDISESVIRFPWLDQKEVVQLLLTTDVFLYPSISAGGWEEQFGYSMAEASLMEVPVIASRTGSIAEVVHDGETGILVPPDDIQSLASAMMDLGQNETSRSRLGKAGRRYVMEKYSNSSVARRMYDFFLSLS